MLLNTIHWKLTEEQEKEFCRIQNLRYEEIDKYRKDHPIHFTEITAEEISKIWDEKIIFLDRPWRMGSEDAHFVIQKDGEFNYYITDWDWYDMIIENVKSFEDYKEKKDQENLKNYTSVYLWFWAMLFIHNDIFDIFNQFVEIKRSWYNSDDLQLFRCSWIPLSKMFIDSLKGNLYQFKGKWECLKFD